MFSNFVSDKLNMMNCIKHILCLFGVLAATMMQGQPLPSLGKAQEITSGKLPNGMSYFIVTNQAHKGSAEYALVQKGPADTAKSRAMLTSLPHFGKRAPYRFLAENGIGYNSDGFIRYGETATVFGFRDVPTWNASVSDSTLLLMFDIAAQSSVAQAVIVSGDVSVDKFKERMNLFSMMVPPVQEFTPDEYEWISRDNISYKTMLTSSSELAAVTVIFSTQRFPRESLDTVEPVLTRAFGEQLGYIFERRIAKAFAGSGLKLAGSNFRYKDASADMEDERYIFTVYVSDQQLKEAVAAVSAVLSDLDRNGASLSELRLARSHVAAEASSGQDVRSNESYVRQCASSWLFGTTLAPNSTINGFVTARHMDDWQELSLFNGFVKALLSPSENIAIRCDLPRFGVGEERVPEIFAGSWAGGSAVAPFVPSGLADSVQLIKPNLKQKVKFKGEASETITGGAMWTFSNGIRVIYKKTATTPASFNYALLLKGGSTNPYTGDMLGVSRIAGVDSDLFHSYLEENGVSMSEEVSLSDLVISGKAQKDKLSFLMEALLTVAGSREQDPQAYERFRADERLKDELPKLSPIDIKARMDSTLSPDFQYILHRSSQSLTDELPQEAAKYFKSRFEMINDGVLVFIGDLDADVLKKELLRVLGSFTTGSHYSQRSKVSSRLASGTLTHIEESAPGFIGPQDRGVNLALSANVPFNSANHMAFIVACDLVRTQLVNMMADCGATVEVSGRTGMYPSERLTMYISCRPCKTEGLPSEVKSYDRDAVLLRLHAFTAGLDDFRVNQNALKASRNALLSSEQARMGRDEVIMQNVLTRYSEGKDLFTGYQDAVKAVNAEKVKSILSQLKAGAGVEYIIK